MAGLLMILMTPSWIGACLGDLSGQWKMDYEVIGGCTDDRFSDSSMLYVTEDSSTLHGSSSLNWREDGHLIGATDDQAFEIAVTFRQEPVLFIRLKGERLDDVLSGRFTASSSDGRFWWGNFTASRPLPGVAADSGSDPGSYIVPDAGLEPKPLRFVDPEAIWSNQTGKEHRDIFAITYEENTILMCRNVPMIWQWWL
jgi:hypothetical protein